MLDVLLCILTSPKLRQLELAPKMSDVVVDVMFLTLDGSDLAQNARLRNLVLFLTENLNNSVLLFKKHQIYITLRMFISV